MNIKYTIEVLLLFLACAISYSAGFTVADKNLSDYKDYYNASEAFIDSIYKTDTDKFLDVYSENESYNNYINQLTKIQNAYENDFN